MSKSSRTRSHSDVPLRDSSRCCSGTLSSILSLESSRRRINLLLSIYTPIHSQKVRSNFSPPFNHLHSSWLGRSKYFVVPTLTCSAVRRALITKRLRKITNGHASDILTAVDDRERPLATWCVGVRWKTYSKEVLLEIVEVSPLRFSRLRRSATARTYDTSG